MRRLATLLVVLSVTSGTRAFADPKAEAKKHLEKAMQDHAAGKFEDALGELTLAYSLDPQPNLLYAIGQVHVKLGHCAEAIDFYQRFLASKPPAGPAGEAQQAIETCQKHATLEPLVNEPKTPAKPVEPPPPPPPAPRSLPPPPPPPPPGPSPFYADLVGDALVGAGVIAGIVGIVEYTGARSDLDSADKQSTYDAHQKLVDDASSKRTLSVIFGAAGGALVVGGVVRYLVHDRTEGSHGVAIVPTTRGGVVTWSARF